MPRTGRSVFAVLSARVGSIGDNRLGGWYGYRASKAALNQLIRTLAIEDKRRNDRGLVVALHPGTVATRLSAPFRQSGRDLFQPDRAAVQLLDVLDGLKPTDSGRHFAWDGAEVPA
jgi:NAD(P)-dependent dehydrogenase (short-subunit alcohol dehydrogenase family)